MYPKELKELSKTDKRFLREWSKTRELGRLKYTLIFGILEGLVSFLFLGLYNLWGGSFQDVFWSLSAFYNLIGCVCAGLILSGVYLWWINERSYQKNIHLMQEEDWTEEDKMNLDGLEKTSIPNPEKEKDPFIIQKKSFK